VLPLLNGLVHLDRLAAVVWRRRRARRRRLCRRKPAAGRQHPAPQPALRHRVRRAPRRRQRTHPGDLAAEFEDSKVAAPPSENVMLDMWEKFVMIATMAGMNCLMRGTVGDINATDDGAALMLQLFAENQAVAAAAGYPPRQAYCDNIAKMLTEKGSPNNASMHHDLAHGSRTEGDWIVGDMRRRAGKLGVDTPLLRAAFAHLQVYENRRAAQR
jgi:2-dehydropantoate 2-reductase